MFGESQALQPQQDGPRARRADHRHRAVRKDMPLEVSVIGTVEAYSTVTVRAQITGELTSVNFQQGDDVAGRAGALHARPPAARSGAAAGHRESRTRFGPGRERESDPAALRAAGAARHRRARAARHRARQRRRARGHARRRSRGGRERQGAAAVRDHPRADQRTNRRADGQRRQPGARQRSDAARHHQPGDADLRLVCVPRSDVVGLAALHGARARSASRRVRPAATGPRASRPHHLRGQRGRSDDGHHQDQGDVCQRGSHGSGPASSSTSWSG